MRIKIYNHVLQGFFNILRGVKGFFKKISWFKNPSFYGIKNESAGSGIRTRGLTVSQEKVRALLNTL
jgi:hypothetical protein